MMTVSNFIEALGGTTVVANDLGLAPTTVSSWKSANSVPNWRAPGLVHLAEQRGVELPPWLSSRNPPALESRAHNSTSAADNEMPDWALTEQEIDDLALPAADLRVVICAECNFRLDDTRVRGCQAMDCPHAQREAA